MKKFDSILNISNSDNFVNFLYYLLNFLASKSPMIRPLTLFAIFQVYHVEILLASQFHQCCRHHIHKKS